MKRDKFNKIKIIKDRLTYNIGANFKLIPIYLKLNSSAKLTKVILDNTKRGTEL